VKAALKYIPVVIVLVTVAALAEQPVTDHAAATVANLHDSMLNPPTFVLDAVYVTKPDKHGNVSVCYEYRSQNVSGGMSAGRAVEDHKGELSTYQVTRTDDVPGYNAGWVAPCKSKNIDRDITKAVASAAPALYKKER